MNNRGRWKAATKTLAKLHAVPYKDVGLGKFGKAGGYYTRQMKTFKAISEAQAAAEDIKTRQKVGPVPHQTQLLEWFAKNLPNDRTCIVHGDYKLDNMVAPTTPHCPELTVGIPPKRTPRTRSPRLGIVNNRTPPLRPSKSCAAPHALRRSPIRSSPQHGRIPVPLHNPGMVHGRSRLGSHRRFYLCECILFVEDEYYFTGNCGEVCTGSGFQCGSQGVGAEDVSVGGVVVEMH